jgi:hypothetical protein
MANAIGYMLSPHPRLDPIRRAGDFNQKLCVKLSHFGRNLPFLGYDGSNSERKWLENSKNRYDFLCPVPTPNLSQ